MAFNLEALLIDLEELLGFAAAFVPVTAPFAPVALATLPKITHDIMTATSGKVDAATQQALIVGAVSATAKAVDSVSTGGQKATLDAITQPMAEGQPSVVEAMAGKMISIYQNYSAMAS